ncbi:hypothetical protein PGT21_023143 [Puccinia graminis f. sp. tritici]|uniref:Uncharacterized protein n=1 Tax=Puccinia graminis f. sp. tritici TaxID=56615 RepID=A0A5B0PY75_PUCGR|nr:hypothetical protein PGT21_023143 [Puccinia graminis f. sp. tritici]KAA1121044.1 hypothetical protein PGTUg99_028680 [Puccinia graminis f. sp. tritici]
MITTRNQLYDAQLSSFFPTSFRKCLVIHLILVFLSLNRLADPSIASRIDMMNLQTSFSDPENHT